MNYGECGIERKPGAGRRAALAHTPAELCSPPSACRPDGGRQLLGLWGEGLSSLPSEPSGLWGLLTVPGLAPLPSVLCRWQLKISSARRRYLVIFSFTASHLSLLGSTVGRRGPVLGRALGFGLPLPALCPPEEVVPISDAAQWILTPPLSLGPPLDGRPAGEEEEGWWQERLGTTVATQPTALYSWHLLPRWPPSHPGKGHSVDFHVRFTE